MCRLNEQVGRRLASTRIDAQLDGTPRRNRQGQEATGYRSGEACRNDVGSHTGLEFHLRSRYWRCSNSGSVRPRHRFRRIDETQLEATRQAP